MVGSHTIYVERDMDGIIRLGDGTRLPIVNRMGLSWMELYLINGGLFVGRIGYIVRVYRVLDIVLWPQGIGELLERGG